jgi:RNA polymerase sigma-70 factor (ECF subfamily)
MTANAGVQPILVGGGSTVDDGRKVPAPSAPRPWASGAGAMVDRSAGPRPLDGPGAAAHCAGGRREEATAPERPAAPAAPGGDAALASECRRGDPGALERLVERVQAPIFGTVLRLVGERDAALELTNAVLFKLARSLDRYDPSRPLRPWVLRFATNEALNWLRVRRRERQRLLGGAAGAAALARGAGGPDPEAAALAAERRAAVRAALARLPARTRLLLTLRFVGELSYREIAAQTEQDPNTVGVQLLRARRRLREELRRGGYPDG